MLTFACSLSELFTIPEDDTEDPVTAAYATKPEVRMTDSANTRCVHAGVCRYSIVFDSERYYCSHCW